MEFVVESFVPEYIPVLGLVRFPSVDSSKQDFGRDSQKFALSEISPMKPSFFEPKLITESEIP